VARSQYLGHTGDVHRMHHIPGGSSGIDLSMTKHIARTPNSPAAYLRQSKDDPDGIARQREDTLALCERKKWPVR